MNKIMISRNIRLVPNDWDRLSVLADKYNMRISELVRLAIREYLKYRV
jgi:predicted transcriptional regulator